MTHISPSLPGAARPLGEQVQAERTRVGSDVGWKWFVVIWLVMATVSVAMLAGGVDWLIPALILGPVTLLGMAWRPTFGLAVMWAAMPVGLGLSVGGVFTLEKGLGILLAAGTLLHFLGTRKTLRGSALPFLALASLVLLSWASTTWSRIPTETLTKSLTLTQLAVYTLIIVSVCRKERDLVWPLRSFVVACLLTFVAARFFGFGGGTQARFTLAYGEEAAGVNPGRFSAILALGFFAAIYLYIRDRRSMFRWVCMAAFFVLPVAVFMGASRKIFYSLGVPLLLPLFSPKVFARYGKLILGMLGAAILLGATYYVASRYVLAPETVERLTDVQYAIRSIDLRVNFIEQAIAYVSRHPLGAGMGAFFTPRGRVVHTDAFYIVACLGIPGGLIWGGFTLGMLVGAWRMKPGIDRWFALAIVVFQLLLGLAAAWVIYKHFWVFMAVAALLWRFQKEGTSMGEMEAAAAGTTAGSADVQAAGKPPLPPQAGSPGTPGRGPE